MAPLSRHHFFPSIQDSFVDVFQVRRTQSRTVTAFLQFLGVTFEWWSSRLVVLTDSRSVDHSHDLFWTLTVVCSKKGKLVEFCEFRFLD